MILIFILGNVSLMISNILKKDFNKSDYKHIKIRKNWEEIYCDNSALVFAKTKDGYLEIYDRDLNYLKKILLPENKKIIFFGFDIIIVKLDGTVWKYNCENDDDFIKIEGPSNVTDFYVNVFYYLYKDNKGDFYYIYKYLDSENPQTHSLNNFDNPHLVNNLHNAEILQFDISLVYTKDGNTYIRYYTIYDKDEIKLFDKDNNVKYQECLEGITCTRAIESGSRIYLLDKNRIGYVYKNDLNEIVFIRPIETNLKIANLEYAFSAPDISDTYILDNNGKLYGDIYKFFIKAKNEPKNEPIFKYKKFKNIYSGFYLYASDGKYLYKLLND